MKKFLTDIHTHSKYSFDGQNELSEMLETAHAMGFDFYGVAEHFEYDLLCLPVLPRELIDPETYFHGARHLQEDYEGCMNVLIGAEFSYADDKKVHAIHRENYEKYRPDFVVNSVHTVNGEDYYDKQIYYRTDENGQRVLRDKKEVYEEYLGLVKQSLLVDYPYDIVGHIGYIARYAPFEDRQFRLSEFGTEIDEILNAIIQKNKILEINTANKGLENRTLPAWEIVERYYALGGRKISYGSDAHFQERIADKWGEVVEKLKEIGFTYLTVPFRGEHIKVEI